MSTLIWASIVTGEFIGLVQLTRQKRDAVALAQLALKHAEELAEENDRLKGKRKPLEPTYAPRPASEQPTDKLPSPEAVRAAVAAKMRDGETDP